MPSTTCSDWLRAGGAADGSDFPHLERGRPVGTHEWSILVHLKSHENYVMFEQCFIEHRVRRTCAIAGHNSETEELWYVNLMVKVTIRSKST